MGCPCHQWKYLLKTLKEKLPKMQLTFQKEKKDLSVQRQGKFEFAAVADIIIRHDENMKT